MGQTPVCAHRGVILSAAFSSFPICLNSHIHSYQYWKASFCNDGPLLRLNSGFNCKKGAAWALVNNTLMHNSYTTQAQPPTKACMTKSDALHHMAKARKSLVSLAE